MKRLINILLLLTIVLISFNPLVIAVELESNTGVPMEERSESEDNSEIGNSEEPEYQTVETEPQISTGMEEEDNELLETNPTEEHEAVENNAELTIDSSGEDSLQREVPPADIIKDPNFNNNQQEYIGNSLTEYKSENLLSKTAEMLNLMPEIIKMGENEIKFSVTHYHGFKNVTDVVSSTGYYKYPGVGPLLPAMMNNEEFEQVKLNFSNYIFTGDLKEEDFDLENITVEQGELEITGEGTPAKSVEFNGKTKKWRPLYKATSTITIKTKKKLNPGLEFSIQPGATWVTTIASLEAPTSAPMKVTYNPTRITSRVQFEKLDFKTTPLDTEITAKPDSKTMFEVSTKRSDGAVMGPDEKIGQTEELLKEQYDFQVAQTANGETVEGYDPVPLSEFIEKESAKLPDGLKYELRFSKENTGNSSSVTKFNAVQYLGWTEINNEKQSIDNLAGFYPVLAVVDDEGVISSSYPLIYGSELKPQSQDTQAPRYNYGSEDKPELIKIEKGLNTRPNDLALVNDFHKSQVSVYDVYANDYHDGNDLIYHIKTSDGKEISYGKDVADDENLEREKFSIPIDKNGYHEFWSYLEDQSGNKSQTIKWEVTIGNPVKTPELVLEGDSLTYTVDMKKDATTGIPDEGQTSVLKIKNAKTPGYKLNVKRSDKPKEDSLFEPDKLTIKVGEEDQLITSDPLELLKLSEALDETVEIKLADKLTFKDLTSSELVEINKGKNTVTLSWELTTDDSKIASAESL